MGLLAGAAAALFYKAAGLTLSHYDARAHLIVARRVIDNITPGWQQVGAVWLPLPHLLNLFPVQVDAWYRSGASGVAISVVAFSVICLSTARLTFGATRSMAGVVAALSLVLLNPNLLYLQATPMTEPLLLALVLVAVWFAKDWVETGTDAARRKAGWALALACLTRYEAWPVTAATIVLAAAIRWHATGHPARAAREAARLAAYPVAAIVLFVFHSYFSTGSWFVSGGFYVADNPAQGRPLAAAVSVWWGVHELAGYGVLLAGTAGMLGAIATAILRPKLRAPLLLFVAPVFAAALPWYAFFVGHPFRIRYMIPLLAPLALGLGLAVGLLASRFRIAACAVILAFVWSANHPVDPRAAMVVEAQWDSANAVGRRKVSEVLSAHHEPGQKIMVSMGSLAHYVQELSRSGFNVRDFLHEGNGDIWQGALADPSVWVDWILIEEWAEGGDMLAALGRENPGFLDGFVRVAQGGGVALYRKASAARVRTLSEASPGK